MHAVARLVLNPYFSNIQASWVKMGHDGMRAALQAGANDLGGTLMNESITRAAGAIHGQEMTGEDMRSIASSLGRVLVRRNTLYTHASDVHSRALDPRKYGATLAAALGSGDPTPAQPAV